MIGSVLAASIVDVGGLLELLWVSLAAGVGVIAVFSLSILSWSLANSRNSQGRAIAAVAYGAVCVISLLVCAAAVVLGLIALSQK
jgi:hypothetical protein